ncbi:MAG: lamin tail domain-containing protein [bacterium]
MRTQAYRCIRPSASALAVLIALLGGCDDASTGNADGGFVEADAMRMIRDAVVPDAADRDGGPDATLPPDQGPMWDATTDGGGRDAGPPLDGGPGDASDPGDGGRDPVCFDTPQAPGQQPLDMAPRCRARGGPLRIRDIRDARCPDSAPRPARLPGTPVELPEAIVTAVFSDSFAVQDPEGGPWSGLFVYNRSHADMSALRPGTRVSLSGEVIEFFTLTELVPIGADGFRVLGQGEPPAPIVVSNPARIADGGDLVEPLESLLLEVPWTKVLQTAPDCPRDFGMFVVDGLLRIGGEVSLDYEPAQGDVLASAIGVLHYSFDHQKLLPRSDADLTVITCGGVPDKCEADDCPVTPDAAETGRLIITEFQNNPSGDDSLREYFEIYNPGPGSVDLAGYWAQDCAGNRVDLGGMVAARGYHVRAASVNRAENGGVRADGPMGDMFLPNGYGSILIFDPAGSLVDQVRYTPGDEGWPRRDPGEAAELPEPAADNRAGASWVAASRDYGEGGQGTPGEAYRR